MRTSVKSLAVETYSLMHHEAGNSGDKAGFKCRDLTWDESRQRRGFNLAGLWTKWPSNLQRRVVNKVVKLGWQSTLRRLG